jgi:6-phosphogluconolactonase
MSTSAGRLRVYTSGSGGTAANDFVRVYGLDADSGALVRLGEVATGPVRPGYLAVSPDGRHLYGIGRPEGATARVTAFRIDPTSGALARLEAEGETGGTGGTHIAVHPSGRWALCAHFQGGQVSVVPLGPDGAPGSAVRLLAISPEAHQIVIDGRHVFVPCRSGNVIHQFLFDDVTGELSPNAPAVVEASRPGAGPRHMAFHPSRRWAFVINELDGTLSRCSYDPGAGRLAIAGTVRAVPEGVTERASAHILVHPNGRLVFGSNRDHGSISTFSVDEASGRLELRSNETAGGALRKPRNFALDPSGRYLLAADQAGGGLFVFLIDEARAKLTPVGGPVPDGGNPTFVGTLALP